MHKWYLRLAVYILVVVGLNFVILAYFLGVTIDDHEFGHIHVYIGISFLLSFMMLSMLIYHLIQKMLKPLTDITALIKDLNQGHYWRRTYLQEKDHALYELANDTNLLAERLQKATEHQTMHADRLQAIIRHMASGLLYINQKGRVVMTNQTLLDLLGWDHHYDQSIYYETPLSDEIIEHIRHAFSSEQEQKHHVIVEKSPTDQLDIELFIAPVKGGHEIITGMVLVFHDITELKQLEQTRQDFVANVSHELKTPVTSIKGFSETLLDGAMYSEKHLQEFLGIIRLESERQYRLIQDLLDLSHIERKQLQLNWERVDLNEVVQDTLVLVRSKAENKRIGLHFQAKEVAEVEADPDRLRQILLNIMSNAIQYTPENGQVKIRITPWEDQGYQICVKDTGIGINEQDLPRLFERFYRVDRARSRASGGTGLGLAIVKHLIEAHHGKISVQSKEGEGTEFCVALHARVQSDLMKREI